MPLPFDSEEFRQAWDEWLQHRKEIRKKMTPLATRKALNALQEMGELQAIVAINLSISKGWTGIHQPKADSYNGRGGAPMTDEELQKELGGRFQLPTTKPRKTAQEMAGGRKLSITKITESTNNGAHIEDDGIPF